MKKLVLAVILLFQIYVFLSYYLQFFLLFFTGFTCSNCKCQSSKQSHLGHSENLGTFVMEEEDEESSSRENYPVRGTFYLTNPASNIAVLQPHPLYIEEIGEPSRVVHNVRKSRTFEHQHRHGNFKWSLRHYLTINTFKGLFSASLVSRTLASTKDFFSMKSLFFNERCW